MNATSYGSPENGDWRELSKAAILEPDSTKLSHRAAAAKKGHMDRARELFQENGNNLEAAQALDAAMCSLHALHSTLKHPPPAGIVRNRRPSITKMRSDPRVRSSK